jgi:hypothetical protein
VERGVSVRVGPPNRASPMRAFVVVLGQRRTARAFQAVAARQRDAPALGPGAVARCKPDCPWRTTGSGTPVVAPPVQGCLPVWAAVATPPGARCIWRVGFNAASNGVAEAPGPSTSMAQLPLARVPLATSRERSRTHAWAKPCLAGRPAHSRPAPHVSRTIPDPRMGEALFGRNDLQRQDRSQCPESDREPTHGRSPVWRADPRRSYERSL